MHKLWTSDLDTGIAEIDAANRKIVDYINTLSSAKSSGDREALGRVLDSLLDHVCNHFLFEEHMMQQADYEYRVGHEKVHEIFAKKLADFRGRYHDGETPFEAVQDMLIHWVDEHIRNEDGMYAETVQDKIEQEGGDTWVAGVMKRLFG
jgi:hemerythrin